MICHGNTPNILFILLQAFIDYNTGMGCEQKKVGFGFYWKGIGESGRNRYECIKVMKFGKNYF
ncbi:hypothetical protein GCM10008967_16000 [Bacillus carboniphilus]|uniref:Uncharacterized protein n=1 Tax=Bacillus carboniphilus TaxID=86663 RepID=A0ABN0W5X9_9BACI